MPDAPKFNPYPENTAFVTLKHDWELWAVIWRMGTDCFTELFTVELDAHGRMLDIEAEGLADAALLQNFTVMS